MSVLTTNVYSLRLNSVSSSDGVGAESTVSGRHAGATIDFHLIVCWKEGRGKMCCHRFARDACVSDTRVSGLEGFVWREIGLREDTSVARRPNFKEPLPRESRGGVAPGDERLG